MLGTRVVNVETGEPVEFVRSVSWSFRDPNDLPEAHIVVFPVELDVDETLGEIKTTDETTADWTRYQVRHVNPVDHTLFVNDMAAGVKRTVFVEDIAWHQDSGWENLTAGDTIKMNPRVDQDGDLIATEFIKID